MLKSIKETFESVINMDSNTYINRLTMWNIILIAPTIVVGFYGMNMKLPFAEYDSAAWVVLASIILLLMGYAVFSIMRKHSI